MSAASSPTCVDPAAVAAVLSGVNSALDRQVALKALRSALRPLRLPVGVDLVVVGQEDARRLAGSRWHVVARALREGQELYDAG